ncbi:hypothetical protein ERO13_A12G229800v2 [Gossypium hirsutum]|uniref:Uncharacterized protein LOC107931931 n=1 Tax=Gossypium hirsutum TaxID=3635 RepID=A0A1U8M165_GOSHI|nr:uncharacterized protein LOC107931931 [Gossypium hirsutum]XP_016719388.1 uncharacterized protein LOC107931931 [Gossypium hirsutum]XP_016719389.1 uncharacterized protein LOC107931931 [Gossypium hirsutum]XP_040939498.1 uncharacterized protein LOC107931931 [Gossypium hirsutum]KAG4171746.1 hypothetical protein ERO13_A12G229800v2 [Gossypium hirsutum]KAG4171747.1 hypothetical protein ERO13_A12G229800v2 [Gossypium hirsutum]
MDRRLPRSPVLKSPLLSPKSPAIYEKYKSGCAWGLIHFFDFRQAHSHGKLISDKKRANRQAKCDGHAKNKTRFLTNEEKGQHIDDAVDNRNVAVNSRKPEVKNDVEEEMSVKHLTMKKRVICELQNQQVNPKLVGHAKKKSSRFRARGCKAAIEGYSQPSERNMAEKPSNNNLVSVTEASDNDVSTSNGGNHSCKNIGGKKHGHQTEINLQVEAFVNPKLTDGENLTINEVANRPNDFIEALEVLNSNKELFMKLLQDPNSLLVKHIQDLRDSQTENQPPQSSSTAKTSQCQPKGAEECEGSVDAEMVISKGSDMPQTSNATVVLKSGKQSYPDKISNWPSPPSSHSLRKKEKSVRQTFLSFEHMKKKLRHAMRVNKKEHRQMSLDDIRKSLHEFKQIKDDIKETSRRANESISSSKSYHDVGKMSEFFREVNRRDGIGQTENIVTGIGSKAASSTESCHRTSNMTQRYLNGKFHPSKHLSDMLNRGNEDLSRQQKLRTLMSLPPYDLLPRPAPVRDKEHRFASPQMRFSPYNNYSTVNGYKWRLQKEKKSSYLISPINTLGTQLVSDNKKPDNQLQNAKKSINGDLSPATKVIRTVYSVSDDFSHKGNETSVCPGKVMEEHHAVMWDECKSNALGVILEPNGVQKSDMTQRTEPNSPSGDRTSPWSIDVYSSSPSSIQRTENSDSAGDREEQPSPVSVLEQFFVEESVNSPSTVSLAAEPLVEPFCIDIEEHNATSLLESQLDLKSTAGTSKDKQGSLSESIRAVLQVSGLNWGELSGRWLLSDQMPDASLFNNVEVWPEKSYTDRRLLFGYISDVILEIYQCYFGCSPWISLLYPRLQPAMLSKNLVHEVLRHVDWQLLLELPQQTLQQLVEKDLHKSGMWMDNRLDMEEVFTELVDSILEDLVIDAAIRLQT